MGYLNDRSMYDDVADFHTKFNIPIAGSEPARIPDYTIVEYRTKFLHEEMKEFEDACARGSLVDAFDALMDLAWVAMGTAHYFRLPWDQGWRELVRANNDRVLVTPENCPPEKKYRKDMVMKPPGWRPPDLLRVIRDHNSRLKRVDWGGDRSVVTNAGVESLRAKSGLPHLLYHGSTTLMRNGDDYEAVGPRWWPRPPAPMYNYARRGSVWSVRLQGQEEATEFFINVDSPWLNDGRQQHFGFNCAGEIRPGPRLPPMFDGERRESWRDFDPAD